MTYQGYRSQQIDIRDIFWMSTAVKCHRDRDAKGEIVALSRHDT